MKIAQVQDEIDRAGQASPLLRTRLAAVEQQKLERYQQRYEEYIKTAKAIAAYARRVLESRVKMLIVGGTIFLGRAPRRRGVGARLTRSPPSVVAVTSRSSHPDVEKLQGDRNGDVTALEGRYWDAVIDTCGYVPSGVDARD